MDNKNRNIWIGVLVIVVIVVVVWMMRHNGTPVTNTSTNGTETSTEPAESTQDVSGADQGSVSAVSLSYSAALQKYADRRIQLDKTCQATPNTVTYKDNTGIMIDNRSPVTRTVKVGTTFSIKPWGFKIVVLPDVYLKSQTLLVDCGTSQNVATVLVQE